MSFAVFIQSFKDGEPAGLPRRDVCAAFGTYLTVSEPDSWQVRYGEHIFSDIYVHNHDGDDTLIDGLTVNRPCNDERLWEALALILSLGDVVLYSPDHSQPPIVARSSVVQHLPPNMIEALGEPVCLPVGIKLFDFFGD